MGNRISTEDLYKITQSLADRAVSDVKKRREDERKRKEAIKKNREERLAAAAKQNRIPNYKGGSLWDQYKAALASGEAKNANDFITKRDARNTAWNKVGAETLNDDMEALAKSISSTYGTQFDPSKYYSQETINGSSDQVKKMRDRLNALAEYYNTYGGSDDQKKAVGEQIKAYDSELKFLGDLGAHYGQYSSPEAYETLYDNGLYTEKYQGKNYSDIQNALKSTTNDREKAWLEKNADSFMTAAEAQAEIDRIEKAMGTKNIAGQRWTTGFPKIENGKLVYNDNLYDKETGKRLQKLEAIRDSKINKETLEGYGRYLGEANEFATERALFLAKQNNILQHGNETFGVFAPDAKAPYAKNENAQNEASRLSPEKLKAVNEQSGQAFSFLENADWATDDEKKIYDYLLYYKGGEEAKKYLRALSYELNRRAANALDQTVSDMYDKASGLGKTVLNIGSLGMNIIGNPEAAIDTIAHRIVGERVDPNSNNQTFRRIRNVIREKTGADLAKASEGTIFGKELFGENAANMLYGAAMSSLDSLLGGFTFGEGYTAVMGGGAMADEAERLYNKGASDSQIFNRSFAAGLAEYITEKVSMDNLLKAKSPANGLQVAKEILKQAGIEGSEEMASDVLNLVADSIIMADRSEMSESIQKYKDGYIDDNGTYHKGVSEKEAQKLAWQDFFTDAMADGLAGALSGGMMSAGPTISSYKYSKNRAAIQIPSIDPGNAEGLVSNARINDISVLTDVSEALKNGDAEEAGGVISEGIAWYEFLRKYGEKTYGKNQWSEVRGSIDDSISKLKKIQKLVADGSIDAAAIDEVLKNAETSMKTTPTVDMTSANDEKLFSLLAKGEPSNSVIEKNILKDRGTLAAFERLTGLRISGTTVSQKRADVREAFKAVSSSSETLKAAQNAIESGATATEGHKNAAVIIDQAIQENRAENSRLRNSEKVKSTETKAAIDATNRQHRFLETVRNYVINGGDLSGFTESTVANVSGEGGYDSSDTKTTQETVKKRVRADFSAYQDEITATEYNKAVKGSAAEQYTYFSNEEKKLNSDIKNIAESEAMTAEEKAEAIEKKNEEKNRLYALAKSTENVREMMRVKYAGNVDRLVEELQPKLKKYGIKIDVVDNIDAAGKSSSGAYFDRNTNTIKVSRNWDNFNNVVKLVLSGEGLAVTDRASVSFDRAVTQTIAHEIAHADSGLTLDFIKAVAGTQYDAFDLKGRLEHPDDRSWRSEDAQKEKNWRRYVDAYTEQAMLEMKGTEEQRRASAEKVVNDAYIFEEIMADMFGAAVDDMGHSSKAGENIFWAMNRNKPGIIKRILNALERFIARIRGKGAYLAVEQRQAAERLRDMLTGELKRAYGTDVKGEAAVENDGGKRHSLAGANSRTADLNSLGGAYQMYQNGVSMDTIRKRTGWWLGKDGKWRYEISDKEMRFNPDGYVDNPQTVGDYVKHDRLFAAYPWIADIPVHMVDVVTGGSPATNGKYSPDGKFIELKKGLTSEKAKYVLSHELQHAIQQAEGFVRGTSPKTGMFYAVNLAYDLVKNNPEFVAESKPQDKMNYLIGYLEAKGGASLGDYAKYYYFQNYGETEARNVSQRLDMTEEERRALPIENNGEVFSYDEVFKKIVDNLKAIGYNKKQIDTILKEGVSYDIEQTDVQTSADEVVKRRRNDRGKAGRLSDADENGRRPGEIYRTGKIPTAGVSESAEILDSERRNGGLRRGNRGTDSQNGALGAGSEAGKRLNEVSKPEKRFSLASSADTVAELQREETELTNRIREIEKSDAFKKANDDLSKAINSDNIAEGMKAYQAWRKESGYADLVDRRDALRADIEKSSESGSGRASAEELAAIEKSGLSEADYFRKQAVKEFGYTPYFYDAGYIMPNGKMLNFSGEKGQHYGSRGEDHRAIGAIYENTEGTDALVRFMNDGNIRIMAETPGLDISASTEPSKEQYTTIRRFANEFSDGGYFAVDLSDGNGKTVGTLEYEGNINPTRIVNDIKHFYETGEVREQSGLDRFRYSLARANDEYMKAVESGNVEEQQRLVDEAAENAGYDTVLYHGTQGFGFTKIDIAKSDDEISFFATSDPVVAKTYSGIHGYRPIGAPIKNVSGMTDQEIIRLMNSGAADSGDDARYFLLNENKIKEIRSFVDSTVEELRKNASANPDGNEVFREIIDAGTPDEVAAAVEKAIIRDIDTGVDKSRLVLFGNLQNILSNLEERRMYPELFTKDKGKGELVGRYVSGSRSTGSVRPIGSLRQKLERIEVMESGKYGENYTNARKGNYRLRAKTDGFWKIKGYGSSWDGFDAKTILSSIKDAGQKAEAEHFLDTYMWGKYEEDPYSESGYSTYYSTRDIAKLAKKLGYRGVMLEDISDIGSFLDVTSNSKLSEILKQRGRESDVYIFFNPEQDVKSADPITYDNDGNVIPLSERFNSKNNDIRYSLTRANNEYMKAVESGDTEEQRRLVDEAAKANGYDRLFWHGSKKGGGFTEFRDWSYFTENKKYASRYAKPGDNSSLYEVYANLGNAFDTRKPECREIFDKMRSEYGLSKVQESGLPDWTDGYDIAEFIDENGLDYDSIILDEGGDLVDGKPVSRGFSYVIRSSEQVKSADPITYDDSGNVIPLTERFDSGNRDIRWSLAGTNKDGIEVYETSDNIKNLTNKERMKRFEDIMKDVYRGRTAKFIRNGHAYYATFEDTDVKKNIYGDKQSSAGGWKAKIRAGADGDIFELVENAEYDRSSAEQGKSNSAHKGINFWDYYVKTVQIDNEVYDLLANVRRNGDDSYVYNIRLYQNKKIKASPPIGIQTNSVKSGAQRSDNSVSQNDPVVNTQSMQGIEKDSSDERHSLVKSAQSELKALQKENEKLRQDVDDLKQELQLTHGRKLSRDALISSIQKILIDRYGVKLSAKELYPHVTNLYDMFYNNTVDGKRLKKDERVDTMRIIEEMDKIVDAVIENAVGVDDTYVEMKKLLPELRNTKLVVPMDARADAAQSAGFENWAEFRKANFGRVGFANEGLPVDTYYMELSERYPELFPDGITNPGEQAAHIADVVNTIRESGINEYQLYDIEDERIRTSIKNDVMDIIGNAEKLQTFADRAAQKVEDTKLAEAMHYGADIAKLKRLNAEKVADIKAENRKRLSDMRRKYQDRVESVRERYAEARANRSEKQKQTVLRNKVLRKYTEASSMLDRPTTENHFTEAMRKPIMEFLAAVDITTGKSVAKQGVYDRILRVIEAANNMAAEDGKDGLDIAETDLNVQEKQLIVDSGLLERMSAWVEANKGKKLTELSSAQLEELNGIFNQLTHVMAEIKRLYDPREGLAAKSWQAQKEIGLAQTKEREQVLGANTERARGMYEQVHFGALDPSGYYNTLGSDTMTAQFERFRQCQNRFSENIQMFTDRLGEIVDGAIPKDEHGKNAKEVTLKLSRGTLTATPAQLMSIHLMLNQEDSRRCLFNEAGGLIIGKFTAEKPKDGKTHIAGKRTFAQSGRLVLNEADAAKITAALTDGQRKRADAISALLNNEAARLGNEVSMAMYGYKKYTTENYFPMRTADDYRAIADNPNYEMNLLGLSFTKERTGRAGKALVAEDIYDVIGRHLTNMAQYNAFAQELDNAKKMYSLRLGDGTSLKQRIIRSYGREADAFYNKLINNLSGVQMYTNNSAEALSDKLLSNYKAAAVAGNVSVVLKQPMSIFRALPEFSLSGLKKSMAFEDILNLSPKQLKANTAEMLKYSGIARLKAWGSSENMTRKSFESLYNDNSDTARQKINEFLTSGAENADMWTWAKLWRMSKAEIDAQGKYTAGSKEYFEAVDRKFSDVIGKTQVVQSALDSSMAVQNAKGFGKFLFAFQNEPLKQYSYLISTLNDARRGKPGAKKKLAKVIASSLANTAAVSAISTFMAWLRGTLDRDDDDELLDDLMKEFAGNSIDDLLSGAFAPVWQYIDTIMGAINSGVYGNTVERLDMAALTDLGGLINKYFISQNGGRPNLGTVQDIVNVASNLFGLPAKNIFRDVKSVIDRIILELPVPSAAKYNYLKAWKDVELTNKAAVTEAYYDVLRDAVDRGRYSDYVKIKRDMIYHGYTETKIKNAVMKSSLMDDLYELKKVNPGSYKAKVNSIVSSVSAVSSLEGKEFEDFIESAMKRREREDGGSKTDDEVYDEMHRKMEKEVKEQLIYIDVSKRAAYIKKMLKTYGEYGITEADILKVLRKAGKA